MSFPNPDHFEDSAAQWRPVAGRPSVFVHDDHANGCEAEIHRVECADCGESAVVCYAMCGCGDHLPTHSVDELRAAHETCRGCGTAMARLALPEDGSWPITRHEREEAAERERLAAELQEQEDARARAAEMAERLREYAAEHPDLAAILGLPGAQEA